MAPSGGLTWGYVSNVTETQYEEAAGALDRALLGAIGLPEDIDIREFENGVYAMTEKVKSLVVDFNVGKFIGILPLLIADGEALWAEVKPKLTEPMERKDFIYRVIRYVYKKHDPDLPVLVEPFETLVENMILGAIPGLIDSLEGQLEKLEAKLRSIFGG